MGKYFEMEIIRDRHGMVALKLRPAGWKNGAYGVMIDGNSVWREGWVALKLPPARGLLMAWGDEILLSRLRYA